MPRFFRSPHWRDFSRNLWMVLATVGALLVVFVLVRPLAIFAPSPGPPGLADRPEPVEVVRVVGPRRISIRSDTPFAQKKLEVFQARSSRAAYPLLTVTGSIVARTEGEQSSEEDRWQFRDAELQGLYTDWIKAGSELGFAQKQLEKMQQLLAAQLGHLETVVERMRGVVEVGTGPRRELVAAEAEFLQAQLEGEQQVYERELALQQARRDVASLERQLFQAGVSPRLLRDTEQTDLAIAVAEVPEIYIPTIRIGQACSVRVYGELGRRFEAEVKAVSPSLSPERRTLRVFFELPSPQENLIPGMYAEIDLGTEQRELLLLPTDAVVHIGRTDYVLVREPGDVWRVTPVRVGLPRGGQIEVLGGLQGGEEVIGSGMILLKPFVVRALASQQDEL